MHSDGVVRKPFRINRKRVVSSRSASEHELRWGPRPVILRTRMRFSPEIVATEFADVSAPDVIRNRMVTLAIPNNSGSYFELPVHFHDCLLVEHVFSLLEVSMENFLELTLAQHSQLYYIICQSAYELTIRRKPTETSWAYHFSLVGTTDEPRYRIDTTMEDGRVRWQTHPGFQGLCVSEPTWGLNVTEELSLVRSGNVALMKKVYDPSAERALRTYLRDLQLVM